MIQRGLVTWSATFFFLIGVQENFAAFTVIYSVWILSFTVVAGSNVELFKLKKKPKKSLFP